MQRGGGTTLARCCATEGRPGDATMRTLAAGSRELKTPTTCSLQNSRRGAWRRGGALLCSETEGSRRRRRHARCMTTECGSPDTQQWTVVAGRPGDGKARRRGVAFLVWPGGPWERDRELEERERSREYGRVEVRGSQRGNGRERKGWGVGGDGVREQMQGGGGTTLAAVPPKVGPEMRRCGP